MNYSYIYKELIHHRHRTLVNILGIGVGIALFVSINAVSTAYQEAISLPFKNLGADIVVQRPEKRAIDSSQAPAAMRGIRVPFSNQLLPEGIASILMDLPKVVEYSEIVCDGFRSILKCDPLFFSRSGPMRRADLVRFPREFALDTAESPPYFFETAAMMYQEVVKDPSLVRSFGDVDIHWIQYLKSPELVVAVVRCSEDDVGLQVLHRLLFLLFPLSFLFYLSLLCSLYFFSPSSLSSMNRPRFLLSFISMLVLIVHRIPRQ